MVDEHKKGSDDPNDVAWARKDAEDEVARLRDGAERWRNAIATATGVVSAALIFRGSDPVVGLSVGSRITLYILIVTAVIAGVVASYFAVLASAGRPEKGRIETTVDAVNNSRKTLVDRIIMRRRLGIGLCGLMVVLIIVSVGLGWFLPRSEATMARVEATDGRVVCGKFVSIDQDQIVVSVFGQEVPVPRNQVRSLGESKSCG